MVPQPVKAVFLLYPITEKSEAKLESVDNSTNIYFTKQTIPNACGTIAMVHALLNNLDILKGFLIVINGNRKFRVTKII
jgi:ubiquitin carboxyl-terminal hydrolase L3